MSTYAYLYKWTELSTGKWYIGSRTRKGCHPEDGYICSSDIVKPLIMENKNNWRRDILCIGEPVYIRTLEASFLKQLDAATDPMSYNRQNQDGKFSRAGLESPTTGKVWSDEEKQKLSRIQKERFKDPELRKKLSELKKGKPGRVQSEEERKKRSETLKGRIRSEEHCRNLSNSLSGRKNGPRSEETKKKIGESRKGIPRSEETKQKLRDFYKKKKEFQLNKDHPID